MFRGPDFIRIIADSDFSMEEYKTGAPQLVMYQINNVSENDGKTIFSYRISDREEQKSYIDLVEEMENWLYSGNYLIIFGNIEIPAKNSEMIVMSRIVELAQILHAVDEFSDKVMAILLYEEDRS